MESTGEHDVGQLDLQHRRPERRQAGMAFACGGSDVPLPRRSSEMLHRQAYQIGRAHQLHPRQANGYTASGSVAGMERKGTEDAVAAGFLPLVWSTENWMASTMALSRWSNRAEGQPGDRWATKSGRLG